MKKEESATKKRLDKLLNLLLDNEIDQDTYNEKSKQLKSRRKEVQRLINSHNEADEQFNDSLVKMFQIAHNAYDYFTKCSQNSLKREIVNCVFANMTMTGAKLEYTVRSPFDRVPEIGGCKGWLREQDSNLRQRD